MVTLRPLQLLSAHHTPVTDVHVVLKRIECEKKVFCRKNVAKERLSAIDTFR